MKKINFILLTILLVLPFVFVSFSEPDGVCKPSVTAVDLGLPSGIKWASCNVDASYPEEKGGYYAWGEVEEIKKSRGGHGWSEYVLCNGRFDNMLKYTHDTIIYNVVDNKTKLELVDDVANVKWGGKWRIPTKEEFDELVEKCTWKKVLMNGVLGWNVKGPNGNTIFLPAAGSLQSYDREHIKEMIEIYPHIMSQKVMHRIIPPPSSTILRNDGSAVEMVYVDMIYGDYWTSSLSLESDGYAYSYRLIGDSFNWGSCNRGYGLTVRPVYDEALSNENN